MFKGLSSAAVVFVIASSSCAKTEAKPSSTDANVSAATSAARSWLARVDEQKYDDSWREAATVFKSKVLEDQWIGAVAGVRGPLGKLVTRRVMSAEVATELPGAPKGKYVVIQFDTAFENKPAAVETITPMQEADGTWRVSGYFIK